MGIAIVASGGGTTFEAIGKHIRSGSLNFQDPLLVTTKKECGAIEKAGKLKVPHRFWSRKVPLHDCIDPEEYPVVCLAGCLRILQPEKVQAFRTILNSHPGPLPQFGGMGMHGLHVHAAVLKYLGLTDQDPGYSCATIHLVDGGVDTGPVVKEFWLKVILGTMDPEDLAGELLPFEHRIYLDALGELAAGTLVPLPADRSRQVSFNHPSELERARAYGQAYGQDPDAKAPASRSAGDSYRHGI